MKRGHEYEHFSIFIQISLYMGYMFVCCFLVYYFHNKWNGSWVAALLKNRFWHFLDSTCFMLGWGSEADSEVWIFTLHEGVKNVSALCSLVKHSFARWTNQSLSLFIMVTRVAEYRFGMHRFYRKMYWRRCLWATMVAGACVLDVVSLFKLSERKENMGFGWMQSGGCSNQGQYVLTFTWPPLPLAFIYIIVGLFTPFKDIIIYCFSAHSQCCLPLHPEGCGLRTRQQ